MSGGSATPLGWGTQFQRDTDIPLSCLQHRQNIPRWILEPCNGWPVAARDATRVSLQVWLVVDFKTHATLVEFIHSFFYARYGKIQNGECGGLVIGLGIHQGSGAAGEFQFDRALRSGREFDAERLAVKFLGLLNVVHRETAECSIGI